MGKKRRKRKRNNTKQVNRKKMKKKETKKYIRFLQTWIAKLPCGMNGLIYDNENKKTAADVPSMTGYCMYKRK